MSTNHPLIKYQDWIRWGVLAILLLGQYWAGAHFVTRTDYDRDQNALAQEIRSLNASFVSLDKAISLLTASGRIDDEQDRRLADHEQRLRKLEARP
ncbi:MAG: hypothetical protein M1608_13785 [Candidatus Omnitrophica bacterium]|nr:hypothetical protein [Candidatus Omnitrophota bacterium]